MQINWNRYIIEHLPISLRKIGIYALLKVLLSPILYVYNKYVKYSNKMRQQSAYTPQMCMLVKIIHDELGLTSTIEESDGKPYDFRVLVDVANTDVERRLIALISKYKLAGKNFVLNNAAITWQQVWDNYQCEKNDISYVFANYVCEKLEYQGTWGDYVCERFDISHTFDNYVCEQIGKQTNYIHLAEEANKLVRVTVDYNVSSDITVSMRIRTHSGFADTRKTTIPRTGYQSYIDLTDYVGLISETLSIYEDDNYVYEIVEDTPFNPA